MENADLGPVDFPVKVNYMREKIFTFASILTADLAFYLAFLLRYLHFS
jgi:hypothetical protein